MIGQARWLLIGAVLVCFIAHIHSQNNFRPINRPFRGRNNRRPNNNNNIRQGRQFNNNNNNFRGQNNVRNQNNFRNQNNNFRNQNNRQVNNNNRFVPQNNNNNRQQAQFSNNNNNNRRPNNVITNNNNNINNPNFRATPADGRDKLGNEIYPGCNGTVCLPVAQLCAQRKNKPGHFNYNGKSYWVSWSSDEQKLRNARWNWFTGRNYCRKMCMDMVSFETQREQQFIEGLMNNVGLDNLHTAGRLCDAEVEGCNQTRFQPLRINGWFWASTLKMMPPTNVQAPNRFFNNWAAGQPDGTLRNDGFGNEACTALIKKNGQFKWYDEACNSRRHLACEDLPVPNINFVRNQNPNINIP